MSLAKVTARRYFVKQLEKEQNHRNGDHMEGYQWGGGRGEWRKKVQRIRIIIGRHKIGGR